jgi:hypothetical protein
MVQEFKAFKRLKSSESFPDLRGPSPMILGKGKLCRRHDLSVDEILNFMALINQIPTDHPMVGSH